MPKVQLYSIANNTRIRIMKKYYVNNANNANNPNKYKTCQEYRDHKECK